MYSLLLTSILVATCSSSYSKTRQYTRAFNWDDYNYNYEEEEEIGAAGAAIGTIGTVVLQGAVGVVALGAAFICLEGVLMATIMGLAASQMNKPTPYKKWHIQNPPDGEFGNQEVTLTLKNGNTKTIKPNTVVSVGNWGMLDQHYFYGFMGYDEAGQDDRPRWLKVERGALNLRQNPTFKVITEGDVLEEVKKVDTIKTLDPVKEYNIRSKQSCEKKDNAMTGYGNIDYNLYGSKKTAYLKGFAAGIHAAEKRTGRLLNAVGRV